MSVLEGFLPRLEQPEFIRISLHMRGQYRNIVATDIDETRLLEPMPLCILNLREGNSQLRHQRSIAVTHYYDEDIASSHFFQRHSVYFAGAQVCSWIVEVCEDLHVKRSQAVHKLEEDQLSAFLQLVRHCGIQPRVP